ncbi:hypothetical protein EK21DRAFT_99541 [Setomelanomma holmii]|uniref:Ubiquitin-like domain-containing protein n=1 Tax=Setomelanomma holmii TaxID=210430 RepID=A0A9P4LQ85_9PLEO|nr:hypothetical protein EK21DRAFT_99541 [Setomelanomma holmii]
MAKPLDIKLQTDHVLVNNDLKISFQTSYLPPNLGAFPLKPVSTYADKLTASMVSKGSLFFPMYQCEAMWINFSCKQRQDYMMKIYFGGVDAISGESAIETAATKLRRQQRKAEGKLLQDYIVVPGQLWLDGIANSDGTVRQFFAMPFGSGHSVEHQVTGQDAAGGIQIEITPYKERPGDGHLITILTLTGKHIELNTSKTDTIEIIKNRIHEKEGIPNHVTLESYGVTKKSTLFLILRLRGGGAPQHEMSVAAGGQIHQVIEKDHLGEDWLVDRTTVFNVQVLNSAVYRAVTGNAPPTKPVDAQTYKNNNLPFVKLYEEPSGISGDFSMVKSIGEIEGKADNKVEPKVLHIGGGDTRESAVTAPVGLINPNGPLREFRTKGDLEKEYDGYHVATF